MDEPRESRRGGVDGGRLDEVIALGPGVARIGHASEYGMAPNAHGGSAGRRLRDLGDPR